MAAEKERDPGSSSAEIGKYLDILAKDPNSRVFAPLAEAYRKAGFFDDAVETALEGLKVHPNYLGGRVALGRAYFEKKQYAEAAVEMQKVARSAPDNIIAHKVLGQIAGIQNDLPAAEKAFKMVLLLDPRDQEAQQFIANLAGTVTAAPVPPPIKVPPAPTMPAPSPPLPQPVALPPSALPPPAPSPAAPLPFDEIQTIEDVDLQAEDILGEQPPAPAPEPVFELSTEPVFDLESEPASEPVVEAEPDDSPFEVFTRDRGGKAAMAPVKVERGGAAGPRELEIETTAYNPPDAFISDGVAAPLVSPEEEVPRSASTQEIDFGSRDDSSPSIVAPMPEQEPELQPEQKLKTEPKAEFELEPGLKPEPEPEPEPELRPERELETDLEPGFEPEPALAIELEPELVTELKPELTTEPEPALETELEPELVTEPELELEVALEPELLTGIQPELATSPEPGPEMDLEVDLASDESAPPSIEPAPQMAFEPPGEEYEDLSPEEEEPAAGDVGRGVFDTETLAAIYTSQGFYGRAAEIYQRLIVQRPDDAGLRDKLEDLLALERKEMGLEEPVAAVAAAVAPFPSPAPPAPAPAAAKSAGARRTGPDQTISQLNALLEAFKGGRPR